ncbi:MAG TPA: proline--tRNA ligase [Thermoanaerobaculia bacterium]|nr:proline--tRNA ligase [Thermoanaerobaculia bacterium]
MRWSQSFLVTLREVPGDAEVVSHQLLYRAGFIQKLAAGVYSYTPFGFRSLRKMTEIVREEMDATGALEVELPILQPKELWVESGRWDRYQAEGILFHLKDRKDGEFALAPTAEEAVTDMVRRSVTSWRQLPFNLYQIRTKFRDEIRPRFGLLRGREFLMKDAYSFDLDQKGLDAHYAKMDAAYRKIFDRCGLEFAVVQADSGAIGGSASEEFMVVADTGEDALVFSEAGDYGANIEKATTAPLPEPWAGEEAKPFQKAGATTPGITTTEGQAKHLKTEPARIVNTMVYEAVDADGKARLVAVLIRGDLAINEVKLPKAIGALHVKLASEEILRKVTGTRPGFVGPLSLLPFEENPILLFVDRSLEHGVNVWCGANLDDHHHAQVSIPRDVMSDPAFAGVVEVATARDGDPSPAPKGGALRIKRGIEVGHIFKLGTKYSEAMKCEVADQAQKMVPLAMGCYGLGLGRTIAAAIEQHHDEHGIVWPVPLAPYACVVAALQRDADVLAAADRLYGELKAAGVEVFYDDRDERPGVKFKDIDLIGFPVRVVVGGKSLAKGVVEVSTRREKLAQGIALGSVVEIVKKTLAAGAKTLAV